MGHAYPPTYPPTPSHAVTIHTYTTISTVQSYTPDLPKINLRFLAIDSPLCKKARCVVQYILYTGLDAILPRSIFVCCAALLACANKVERKKIWWSCLKLS